MPRIGVIAALAEEADALFPGAGQTDNSGAFPLRRVEGVTVLRSGIGKVNAAAAVALLALKEGCGLILSIGTAGRISDIEGHCFWIASAVQHDYGAERSDGFVHYSAGTWPIGPATLEPLLPIADPGLDLPHARIASGDAFIESPDRSQLLAGGLSTDLVDMETAAIAQAAGLFGLPWAAIRAVSDDADGGSAGDFQTNLEAAARDAGAAAERLIALLG